MDIRLGNRSGLELFAELPLRLTPKILVIFITGQGSSDTAIEAMKLGAFDYLVKPLDLQQLQLVVEQALKISQLMHVPAAVDTPQQVADTSDRLIGSGPAMQSICKQIGRIAPQSVNVLVLGESGTGKELVARAIYFHSRRNQGPFLAINCAAIPESLLESELFGHEKGAFTGAEHRRIGKFEQCNNGTIFLDEVGDMPLATQSKILRLLQDGQFQRVGGNETMTVDVRIVAATHQNLESMIEQGRFRNDLYYRLPRRATLELPPLRGADRGSAGARPLFLVSLQSSARHDGAVDLDRGLGALRGIRLARKHPRAAKRHSGVVDCVDGTEAVSRVSARRGSEREAEETVREAPTATPDAALTWEAIEQSVQSSMDAGHQDIRASFAHCSFSIT